MCVRFDLAYFPVRGSNKSICISHKTNRVRTSSLHFVLTTLFIIYLFLFYSVFLNGVRMDSICTRNFVYDALWKGKKESFRGLVAQRERSRWSRYFGKTMMCTNVVRFVFCLCVFSAFITIYWYIHFGIARLWRVVLPLGFWNCIAARDWRKYFLGWQSERVRSSSFFFDQLNLNAFSSHLETEKLLNTKLPSMGRNKMKNKTTWKFWNKTDGERRKKNLQLNGKERSGDGE